jgi:hypothetical protein
MRDVNQDRVRRRRREGGDMGLAVGRAVGASGRPHVAHHHPPLLCSSCSCLGVCASCSALLYSTLPALVVVVVVVVVVVALILNFIVGCWVWQAAGDWLFG